MMKSRAFRSARTSRVRHDRRGDRVRPELGTKRNTLDFQTDGLVIKVDDLGQRERLGSRSKSPRWAIAYKFEAEQAITKSSRSASRSARPAS